MSRSIVSIADSKSKANLPYLYSNALKYVISSKVYQTRH